MRHLRLAGVAVWMLLAGCGDDPAPRPAQPTAPRTGYDRDGHRLSTTPAPERPPNLILILIDTLRGDMVNGPEPSMPRLLERARKGVVFRNACSPAPWTVPSITSALTGLLPSVHGSDAPMQAPRLVDAVTTFAEALRNGYGYDTASFTDGPWFDRDSRLLQGFGYSSHNFMLRGIHKIVEGWASRRDPKRPFFLLLHTFEAHEPYGEINHPFPPLMPTNPPYSTIDVSSVHDPVDMTRYFLLDGRARLDLTHQRGPSYRKAVIRYMDQGYREDPRPDLARELKAGYVDGVAWLDGVMDDALKWMESKRLLENTLVFVTSDHGEAFGEHGILGHGRQLYDELVHIPMVAWGPPPFDGGREIQGSVGLIDLLPTYFDWAGLDPLPGLNGGSFLPLLREDGPGRPVFAEERISRANTEVDRLAQLTSVRNARWKYVLTYDMLAGAVLEEAYDLLLDPLERSDLCQGRGRIDGLEFDAEFCEAIEAARDRIWGAVEGVKRRYNSPYGAGEVQVTSERPAACKAAR